MSRVGRLWAHTPASGSDRWHSLDDHLRGTAELAHRFASPFGGGEMAYWLGRLHDLGKASCAWQVGLASAHTTGGPVGIDHKVVGTRTAFERGLRHFAVAIFGHHGGLIDAPSLRGALNKRGNAINDADAGRALPVLLPDLPADLRETVPDAWSRDPMVGEMATRMCFSTLVDADFLDTEAHFRGYSAPRVRSETDFGALVKRFEQGRAEALDRRAPTPIDGLRGGVYDGCLGKAERRPGIFRLAAPTGAGKTLAAAGFGLRHAELHGLRRVIVAVPFLTITEQNAEIYRGLLEASGEDQVVLEHHSGIDLDGPAGGPWARLAAENWDAPFVVTTFVRLFESLFGRRPAAMRRVHRLAGSVIVLDEVQALPHDMLAPILDVLRTLVTHFGATVVLSSATQPDFWALKEFADLPAVDLVDDSTWLAGALRRVHFEWQLDPPPSLADIAAQAAAEPAAIVVVNTTADAKSVYDCWREAAPPEAVWHLSTRMCPDHRRQVLDAVRQRLRNGERVLLVSTQLIEAGVDVDFPIVFRAMAPADSLLQAAGRANRDGRLPQPGRVVIFAPTDGGQPPTYRPLVGQARIHFGPGKADPDDMDALAAYYRSVYDALNLKDPNHVGRRIQQARRGWEFQTVTDGPIIEPATKVRDRRKAFRVIRDEGIAVVTPQGAFESVERRRIQDLIQKVRADPKPNLDDLRGLQPYTTTLHPSALRVPGVTAMLAPILGDEVRPGALVEWCGMYDESTGIDTDPRTEEFVV